MSESEIARERRQWEERLVNPVLEQKGERKPAFVTDSGIGVERLYTPVEREYRSAIGFPGEFPFTRGPYPTMYRGRYWTMRQSL